MSLNINQEITFAAGSIPSFEALTDSRKFAEFSGAPAEIDARVGGTFSCFGGAISGKNLEVVRCTRLVQSWRVENWEEGVYSVVTFALDEDDSGQTKLVFDQTGFPHEHREHLNQGWYDKYWSPLKTYLIK